MDKYYTPEREEFCWGFEYESEEDPRTGIWEKQVVGGWSKFKYFDNDSDVDYRVKYLDKEDIESLGFNQITDDCFSLPIKEYRGRLNQEVRILIRQTILIYLAMDMNYMDKDNLVLFTGNIKNKSEFIKLLKQLGIE